MADSESKPDPYAVDWHAFFRNWERAKAAHPNVLGRMIRRNEPCAVAVGLERGLASAYRYVERGGPEPVPEVPEDGLLTTAQAAKLLGCSARSVTRAVRRGTLRAVRVGGLVRFRRADLERLE